MATGLRLTGKGMADIADALKTLADVEVLVGFPEESTERKPDPEEKAGLTNAVLGYIHDNGAPEAKIPARPFMAPGIQDARERLTDKLGQTMAAVLRGGGNKVVEKGMHQVGLIAASSIKRKINEGVPPPLAPATLRNRARKGRKGAAEELANRKAGLPPSMALAKPLVDTGQLRNAVTYAIRSRKARRK